MLQCAVQRARHGSTVAEELHAAIVHQPILRLKRFPTITILRHLLWYVLLLKLYLPVIGYIYVCSEANLARAVFVVLTALQAMGR